MKKNETVTKNGGMASKPLLTAGVQGAAVREIKFRALKDDMSNCNFVYGQLVYDAIGCPRITEVDSSGEGLTFHTCLRGTEGQYTGLKDKSKKEIYEGDILKTGMDEILKVFFNTSTGSFDVEFLGGDCERLIGEDGWKDDLKQYKYKVIGNIYENAGLWAVAP